MTEFSYWWTTSGTPAGDQVSSYTQAHLARIAAVLAACSDFEGIAPGYLNGMAGSVAGANTVQIATGGAVVDGKVYDNDAAVNVTIPSASGGGNTRIDRIVLRVSWASFTARITRIAGTDAASPTAPAITQTPGTTYDLPLYRALVDTGGTVTLTGEQVWAAPQVDSSTIELSGDGELQIVDGGVGTDQLATDAVTTAKIANSNVTTAKIADSNVTRAKLATGVVISNRQGGSATEWGGASGGNTNYDTAGAKIQIGTKLTGGATSGSGSVTFPAAFSYKPLIFIQPGVESQTIDITAVTVSGFDFDYTAPFAVAFPFYWMAIGPE